MKKIKTIDHTVIPRSIQQVIMQRLQQAEAEHNVRVLYAVESGSRAWGFASTTSDYDVRFIYAHPKAHYLSIDIEKQRDVIEYPIIDDIDISGWDVRKALKLFKKSNPSLIEWLKSPIVYIDDGHFAPQARKLLPQIMSLEKNIYHYRHMAQGNYRGYLKGEFVPLKKYFYVLRPLLTILWIERYAQSAPIEFDVLCTMIENQQELQAAIQQLLTHKRQSKEKQFVATVPVINAFIHTELTRLAGYTDKAIDTPDALEKLNDLFCACCV